MLTVRGLEQKQLYFLGSQGECELGTAAGAGAARELHDLGGVNLKRALAGGREPGGQQRYSEPGNTRSRAFVVLKNPSWQAFSRIARSSRRTLLGLDSPIAEKP